MTKEIVTKCERLFGAFTWFWTNEFGQADFGCPVCSLKLQLFYVDKQEYVNEHIEHTKTNSNRKTYTSSGCTATTQQVGKAGLGTD